jgi:antitoxin VapB
MAKTKAKIFQNGGSQAVRLPKEYRIPATEVSVCREGTRIVLEPLDHWSPAFLACLGAWKEEIERPKQRSLSKVKDPFA